VSARSQFNYLDSNAVTQQNGAETTPAPVPFAIPTIEQSLAGYGTIHVNLAYTGPYGEPLSDARTPLAEFLRILLVPSSSFMPIWSFHPLHPVHPFRSIRSIHVHHPGILASLTAMFSGDVICPIKAAQFSTHV
jgi:hypothetical protein